MTFDVQEVKYGKTVTHGNIFSSSLISAGGTFRLFNGGCPFNTQEEPDQQHAAARGASSCLPASASTGPEISGARLSPVEGGGGGTGSVVRVCERPEATISLSMEIIDALLKCSFPLKPKPSFRHIVTNNSEAIVQ